MGDFNTNQGGKQSIDSTQRTPKTSGKPKTGFTEAPTNECPGKGPGPAVPANKRTIR